MSSRPLPDPNELQAWGLCQTCATPLQGNYKNGKCGECLKKRPNYAEEAFQRTLKMHSPKEGSLTLPKNA